MILFNFFNDHYHRKEIISECCYPLINYHTYLSKRGEVVKQILQSRDSINQILNSDEINFQIFFLIKNFFFNFSQKQHRNFKFHSRFGFFKSRHKRGIRRGWTNNLATNSWKRTFKWPVQQLQGNCENANGDDQGKG